MWTWTNMTKKQICICLILFIFGILMICAAFDDDAGLTDKEIQEKKQEKKLVKKQAETYRMQAKWKLKMAEQRIKKEKDKQEQEELARGKKIIDQEKPDPKLDKEFDRFQDSGLPGEQKCYEEELTKLKGFHKTLPTNQDLRHILKVCQIKNTPEVLEQRLYWKRWKKWQTSGQGVCYLKDVLQQTKYDSNWLKQNGIPFLMDTCGDIAKPSWIAKTYDDLAKDYEKKHQYDN